ncbi:MAG: tetratricopeptide repeat protein [Planctomycetota bacterium]|nr:tetratricopeptide repeat protein [Planctomycetota bacterium]
MKRLLVCLLLLGVVGCSSDPDKAIKEYNKGVSFADREDWSAAITHFNQAIRIDPDYAEAYYNRGLAHRDQYDKAIADFTEAIRIDPGDVEAYYQRGYTYSLQFGQDDKAIADYTEAIRIDPGYVEAYYHRGVAHRESGNDEKAAVDFAKVDELGCKP